MRTLLRIFFRLLYHQFAFTYDLVAAGVSFNRWKDWVMSVVPFLEGDRILEIGHGPGHLQEVLLRRKLTVIGIDESSQMGRLAQRNLKRRSTQKADVVYTQINLTRGIAQRLPFASQTFHTIVATFPTPYISEPDTLSEVRRCLSEGGRFVVLPAALPRNPFLEWLFHVTDQSPVEAIDVVSARFREPFLQAGFQTEVRALEIPSGTLLLILAQK